MSTEIRIPKIGISMTEATLTEWLASDGASIEAGSPLYAIEMDKSTNEVDAPVSGTLKIIGEVGEVYEVGTLVAVIE
ncbi:MAG: dihydrolipoamide acyltransferase [Sphingomonadales bacterium]|jgi:pyruvate/2-oxoglutarate dehydrogenase complex dihydrolipoamide acyltransferase (E2) component|nr:dihydrolipoamide acyltransferase [Sphingomonadales bacterium]